MEKLAIDGGSPLRTSPYPTKMLGAAYIGEEELAELRDVVRERSPFRHYGIGNPHKTRDFEVEARRFLDARFVLAVSSGSAALACAVAALDLGEGDEVVMPAFGWFSDYTTVVASGALPVLADIDDTLNLDPEDFARKITPRTRAVIVVHYQGGPARLDRILSIARGRGIKVLEDCAQAFGGAYHGRPLGTHGDIAVSSFQSNKIITPGEGGRVYTADEELFVRAVRYHDLGFVRPVFLEQIQDKSLGAEELAFAGNQFRMSELCGAFLLAQIRRLPAILARCRASHRRIRETLGARRRFSYRPTDEGDCGITLFLNLGSPEEAKRFAAALAAEGIPLGPSSGCANLARHPMILSKRTAHAGKAPFGPGFAGERVDYASPSVCPNTDRILESHVAIGIGPLFTDTDIDDIARGIDKVDRGLAP